MQLGAFSVSLTVKDLGRSRQFYQKLGFTVVGGDQDQKWLILRNGTTTIGLFEGMFDRNMLTFNPGWSPEAERVDGGFKDVRSIRRELEALGVEVADGNTEERDEGPAHIVIRDPDGNPILIDQHV